MHINDYTNIFIMVKEQNHRYLSNVH